MTRLLRRRWQLPAHFGTALLMVLTCVSLVGLDLRQSWVAYDVRLQGAKTETANLAGSIAQQVHDTFAIAGTGLFDLQERVAVDGVGPAAIDRMERFMRARIASQTLIRALFLINEHGDCLANSVSGSDHHLNYQDREYFRYHRDHTDEGVLIGMPVRSKVDGTWVLTVTRRLNHPDGSFNGILSATISTDKFQNVFRSYDVGAEGVITMTNRERVIMVRRPFDESNINRNIATSQLFRSFDDNATVQSLEYVGLVDGRTRIGSVSRVPGFDLLLLVSREKQEVLASWWQQTQVHLTWMAFALAALTLLAWHKIIKMRAHARAEALYRLLADNSSDAIVCLARDGRRLYVSPAFETLTGWSEGELIAKASHEIVFPDDRPIVAAAIADLMAGSAQVTAVFRYLRRDNTTVWVELLARPSANPTGGPPIFVGNIRNISRQKAIEEQLAATNAELAAVSLTDPLTGIANRRHFDQVLAKEWRRAMRIGADIALMMVDADHFKSYNDLYGHPQGDACLQAIASALASCIRRPGDLAARYGGEEFAVILPGACVDAVAAMAERMRQAVLDQAIEHSGNEIGVVTVSIGVAAVTPQLGTDPATLIRVADQALYEAKRSGRNRVAKGLTAPEPAHPTV